MELDITVPLRAIRGAFLALGETVKSLRAALTTLVQGLASLSMPKRMLSCIAIEKTLLGPRYTLRPIPVTDV